MIPQPPDKLVVDIIIVARNQAHTLAKTLADIPLRQVRSVVVVDNGSNDSSAAVARDAGAVVLREPAAGYGRACRRAIAHLECLPTPPDAVVFLAADGGDDPSLLPALLEPIRVDNAELVIGVRCRRGRPTRTVPERVALQLISTIYRQRFDSLGWFRAVRFPALVALAVTDQGPAFHVEMQIKALKLGIHITEVPIGDRPAYPGDPRDPHRAVRAVHASSKMLFHILRHATTR